MLGSVSFTKKDRHWKILKNGKQTIMEKYDRDFYGLCRCYECLQALR